MATGQGGGESNKLHPSPFQKLTYHTFLSGGKDTHVFCLCSPWTKEPVVEDNDRLKQSPASIHAEKTYWGLFTLPSLFALPLPHLHHRAPGLHLFPIGHRRLLCSGPPSLQCLRPSESRGIYSKSCAAAQTPRGSHPWVSRCSVTRWLEANELSVGPTAMFGSSLPLPNNAHSGVQNVLRTHCGPDTQAGIKDRKVTSIHAVPAVTELQCKKCLSFPIC